MMKFVLHSEAETEAIGEKFARMLHPGDVVAFTGGLGAGKTAFTRGMARTLAPDAEVSSPTFALVNDYGGKVPFWHFDMYRFARWMTCIPPVFLIISSQAGYWLSNGAKILPARCRMGQSMSV